MDLAENYGLGKAMAAGAAAGVMEHLWMFPVDTIKTRMQTDFIPGQRLYKSVPKAISQVRVYILVQLSSPLPTTCVDLVC